MSNIIPEKADDGSIWLSHSLTGTAIAVCKNKGGKWFAADVDDEGFYEQIGPFDNLSQLSDHIEQNKLFGPWISLAN